MRTLATMSALALSMALSGAALAEPVTNEAVETAVQSYTDMFSAGRADGTIRAPGDVAPVVEKALMGLDISDLTFEQLEMLGDGGVFNYAPAEIGSAASARAAHFAKMDDVTGARAAMMAMAMTAMTNKDADAMVKNFGMVLSHPAIGEAMKTEASQQLFGVMRMFNGVDLSAISGQLVAFGMSVNSDWYEGSAPMAGEFLTVVSGVASDEDASKVRKNVMAWMEHVKSSTEDPRLAGSIENQFKYMNGAAGRGELIDHAAPELNFAWSSDPNIEKLSDMNGKVVVVDFWATWCGPCIASFPDVAKLQKFYEGYPVEIIGVTSVQGNHYGKDGKVDTEGNPDKEYGLMPGFMEWKGMSWTVAFSEEEVFNPEYGVKGIPHVAVVDTTGKVRYNGIHPAGPFDEKVEKINKLLKEAGLEYPVYSDEDAGE